MKRIFAVKSVKTRLTFWFLGVALVPLLIVSTVIYQQRVVSIKQEAFRKLTAIRDLKVAQINNWLDERIGDVKAVSIDPELKELTQISLENKTEREKTEIRANIRSLLNRYINLYVAWDELFIISAVSGKVEVSSQKQAEGLQKSDEPYFTEPLKTRGIHIKDIYYSKSLRRPAMTFSIPVYDFGENKTVIGILVCRIDLENSLYAMLLDRSGMGSTGETLIVNKSMVALNELKWFQRAPLRLQIKAKPAVMASQGAIGIVEAKDYRNVEVLAAFGYLPRTKWGFVAKQDLAEIYAPIDLMIRNILILLLISVVVVYGVSLFVANTIARPVVEMTEVSKRLQAGDMSARNMIKRSDELGFLSESFNNMADSLMSQFTVQQTVVKITDSMVAARELSIFSSELIKKLVEITDANLAAFYLRSEQDDQFVHLYSVGGNSESFEPFAASLLEGEFGRVLASKKLSHLHDIPPDTVFKLRLAAGTALPREVITIPILVQDEVKAVISLASLKAFSGEQLEILQQIQVTINTLFANLLANQSTRTLADELTVKNSELENQTIELQEQTTELQRQSSVLHQQNIELEAQSIQVEEANRLKSEFLSNMSHELRTPLNSIMALSRILIRRAKDNLTVEEAGFLEIIERNGRRLLSLINDILDLSKIEAGKMDLSLRQFSISTTIANIVESLEPVAAEKNIEIVLTFPEDLPRIESDEARVHQILQNIIGNALKFTSQGSVTLKLWEETPNIKIQVEDTGIGIAKKELPRIFEEFRQVDGSSSRQFEGTGLGLAIAYKATKLLGGDISVDSRVGQGSIFTISLPVAWWQSTPEDQALKLTPSSAQVYNQKKTVLVVDDDPKIVSMIAGFLLEEGYNAVTATSGREALRQLQSFKPLAVTLDIIMPEMDGWEVLQKLKADPHTSDIPVIIVSIADDRKTGFALGAMGYITKPVDKKVLMDQIKKVGGLQPQTILIVDDNEIERQNMAQMIESQGSMKTITAENGKKGLELIRKSVPDALILDLMMPEMDGFEMLKILRLDSRTRNLPVIIVTAKDLTAAEKRNLQLNVSSIIAKSEMETKSLFEELKRLLGEIQRDSNYAAPRKPREKTKILLVEDNEIAIRQVTNILENEGYLVDTARGGQEAIDYVKLTIPDGIILDLMMPEVDGFAVLEEIRSTKSTAQIPVLILTAKDLTAKDLEKLSVNKVQQLVQKGDVNPEKLLARTKLMLGTLSKIDPKPIQPYRITSPLLEEKEREMPKTTTKTLNTILVVEDNPDNMITIKAMLGDNYTILEARDGEEGLSLAVTHLPDLVLLDMSLPKMDGFTVVRKMRENEKTRSVPVIATTAQAMKGDREKMLEAGCDDYISKPIDPDTILEKINRLLK